MLSGAENSTIVRINFGQVRLRPVSVAEAGPIVDAVFAGLSPQSRYLRFHSPVRQLSESVRRQLTDLDGQRRAAVVAEFVDAAGAAPIGLVRLADAGGGSADVGIAVVDAWQRRGVGRRLLRAVAELAATLGYTELRGLVLPENLAVRRLVRSEYPHARLRFGGDAMVFTMPLGPAAWAVTQEDVLSDLLYRGR